MLNSAFLHDESLLVVFAGPAASGKSSICKKLVEKDPTLRLSISTTTREPRAKEVDGRDYFFVSHDEFQDRVESGAFIEYAKFGENFYGTERKQFESDSVTDILLDIDVQGVKQVRELYAERCVVLFVIPPSFEILEQRLRHRATESAQDIDARLAIARKEFEELRSPSCSDYLLVNDDLDVAISEALSIIHAERRKTSRIEQHVIDAFFDK